MTCLVLERITFEVELAFGRQAQRKIETHKKCSGYLQYALIGRDLIKYWNKD
jgi:hypothetical protein